MSGAGKPARRLRFAVLLDADELEAWQVEALARLRAVAGVEIVLAIVRRGAATKAPRPWWRRFGRHTLYNLVYRRVAARCAALARVPLVSVLPAVPVVESDAQRLPRGRTALPVEILELCAREGVDAFIRFGFGILSGEVLTQPRCGVWSFHHGDPSAFRGMPPGVWEIIRRAPTTGAMVQRLSETLDGGAVLAMARLPTRATSYTRQLDDLLMGAAPLLAHAAAQYLERGALPEVALSGLGPIYRKPTTGAALKLLRMPMARLAGLASALCRHQHWRVVAVRQSLETILARGGDQRVDALGGEMRLLGEEPGMFAADPCAVRAPDGSWKVLVERFDWNAGRGHIAAAALAGDGSFSPLETSLSTPGHLSYPFVHEEPDGAFMLPEAVAEGRLRAYRLAFDPLRTSPAADLGPAVIDPTILRHGGRLWMFHGDVANTRLYIRHAERLEGPWTEHPANPVKIDVANARPAGAIIAVDGMLIRPAQICTPHYGYGLVLNRIDVLTEECYAETPLVRILPAATGRYRHGVHTLAVAGDWLIFDQARVSWQWREFLRVLNAKSRGLFVKQRA